MLPAPKEDVDSSCLDLGDEIRCPPLAALVKPTEDVSIIKWTRTGARATWGFPATLSQRVRSLSLPGAGTATFSSGFLSARGL